MSRIEVEKKCQCIPAREVNKEYNLNASEKNEVIRKSMKHSPKTDRIIEKPRNVGYSNAITTIAEVFLVFGKPSATKKHFIAASHDPDTGKSRKLATLIYRKLPSIISVGNSEAMISGGLFDNTASTSVEVFTYEKKQSRHIASLNVARYEHGSHFVEKLVFVCGGRNVLSNPLKSCEVYSRFKNRWRLLREMKEPRCGLAVVAAPDKRVFAIGGYSVKMLSSVEVYYFGTSRACCWKSLAPMRQARYGHAAVLFNQSIFVVGGERDRICSTSVEVLPIDSRYGKWISISTNTGFRRYSFYLVGTSEALYAFGNNDYPFNSVERMRVSKIQKSETKSPTTPIIDCGFYDQWESISTVTLMKKITGVALI